MYLNNFVVEKFKSALDIWPIDIHNSNGENNNIVQSLIIKLSEYIST